MATPSTVHATGCVTRSVRMAQLFHHEAKADVRWRRWKEVVVATQHTLPVVGVASRVLARRYLLDAAHNLRLLDAVARVAWRAGRRGAPPTSSSRWRPDLAAARQRQRSWRRSTPY